jgi:hypothetical protein
MQSVGHRSNVERREEKGKPGRWDERRCSTDRGWESRRRVSRGNPRPSLVSADRQAYYICCVNVAQHDCTGEDLHKDRASQERMT